MTDAMNALIESLTRIAIALEAATLPLSVEGFRDYGNTLYANVSKGNGDGWYFLEGDKACTQKPILCARVVGLRFETVERRGKEVVKLHLFMKANGEVTTIEAGSNCFFSKTVLSALASASPETLVRPIQLATYIKELRTSDKTLAVAIRDSTGNQLSCNWTNGDDWPGITEQAIANVNAAMSR